MYYMYRLSSDKACTLCRMSFITFYVHHVEATMSPRYNGEPGLNINWKLPLKLPLIVIQAFARPNNLSTARIDGYEQRRR